MSDDLEKWADRATYAYQNEPGFVNCEAIGDSLHYNFSDAFTAEAFKFKRELGECTYELTINDCTVIEKRN